MEVNITSYTVPLEQRTVLAGVFGFLQLVALIGTFLFYTRRQHQPIRSRLPERVVFSTFLIQIDMALCFVAFYLDDNISRNLAIGFIIMFYFALSPLVPRTLTIFSSYEVSLLLSEKGTEDLKELMANGNFYVRNAKFLCGAKFNYGLILFSLVLHVVIVQLRTISPAQSFDTSTQIIGGSLIILVFALVYILLILVLTCRMSSFNDGLHLKHELQLTAAGVVFTVFVTMVLRFVSKSDYTGAIGFAFGPFTIILAQIAMPLYYSYRWDTGKKGNLRLDMSSYDQDHSQTTTDVGSSVYKDKDQLALALDGEKGLALIIKNQGARDMFFEFCRQELNHENLLFYEEAKSFLKLYSGDEKANTDTYKFRVDAERLYNNYLKHGAILEVNVSSKSRELSAGAGFGSESINVDTAFAAIRTALREVMQLIVGDSLYRFKTSNKFDELFDSFQQGLVEA